MSHQNKPAKWIRCASSKGCGESKVLTAIQLQCLNRLPARTQTVHVVSILTDLFFLFCFVFRTVPHKHQNITERASCTTVSPREITFIRFFCVIFPQLTVWLCSPASDETYPHADGAILWCYKALKPATQCSAEAVLLQKAHCSELISEF